MNQKYQFDLFEAKNRTRIVSFEVDEALFLKYQEAVKCKGSSWKEGLEDYMRRVVLDKSGAG